MNLPPVHQLSKASQFSLVAVVILLGAIFFTVNGALQQEQKTASHASNDGLISGNTYYFQNKCSSQAMDVSNNSMDNSANIVQWGLTTSGWNKDRQWVVKDLGNGYYSIQALSSSKYLDVYQNGTVEGTQLIQWSGSGSPTSRYNEQFQISALGNGYYKIVGRNSGKAIGLYACNSNQGLNIRQYNYDGSSRLQWKLINLITQQITPPSSYNPTPGASNCTTVWNGWIPTQVCSTPTPTQTPIAIVDPTPTPYISLPPTPAPTNVPSSVPSGIPTVNAVPTDTPIPTQPPAPGSTVLGLTIALHGIGTGGDSASPNGQGNMNPVHPSRNVTVDIYDSQNQLVVTKQGTIVYDSGTGKFGGTIDLGTTFSTGLYSVKVKTDGYLRVLVPGIQTITSAQTTSLPLATLVDGDVNNDNAINIVDYNILIGCYSDLLPPTDCNATNALISDINDDGHDNQFDYNLFLRELSNVGGQ